MTPTDTIRRAIINQGAFFSPYYLFDVLGRQHAEELDPLGREANRRLLRQNYRKASAHFGETGSKPGEAWHAWYEELFTALGFDATRLRRLDAPVDAGRFGLVPISHVAAPSIDTPPIVFIDLHGFGADLDSQRYPQAGKVVGHSHVTIEPVARAIEFILDQNEARWAIVAAGERLRLYRKGGSVARQYLEVAFTPLFDGDRTDEWTAFWGLFRYDAFVSDLTSGKCLLDRVLEESQRHAARIADDLRENIVLAVEALIQGVLDEPANADVLRNDVKREDVKREDVRREDVKREDVKREDVKREDVKRNKDVKREDDASRFTPSALRFTPSALRFTPSALRFTPSALRFTPSVSRFTPSVLQTLFEETLYFLYRLLFVLYAESRDLLPLGASPVYRDTYSLEHLRAMAEQPLHPDDHAKTYYIESLRTLFALLRTGFPAPGRPLASSPFRIPSFNGQLFDLARTALLDRCRIGDQAMREVIRELSLSRPRRRNDRRERYSYADLGVDQLGSIYEGLLVFEPMITDEVLVVAKVKGEERLLTRAQAEDQGLAIIEGSERTPGSFVLRVWGGRRKGSGSYYTPQEITAFLVKEALEPLVEPIIEGIKREGVKREGVKREGVKREGVKREGVKREGVKREDEGSEVADDALRFTLYDSRLTPYASRFTPEDILEIKVCDPAMGSAAFLVQACRYLAEAYGRARIAAGLDDDGRISQEELARYKRRVAERCLYGVDLNPMAVELAKVSLWLETLSGDRPLTFLDAHLRCGNALIGAPLRDEAGVLSIERILSIPDAALEEVSKEASKAQKAAARERIKRNREQIKNLQRQRGGQMNLPGADTFDLHAFERTLADTLERRRELEISDEGKSAADAVQLVHAKQHMFDSLEHGPASRYRRAKLVLDLWCAIWFWPEDVEREDVKRNDVKRDDVKRDDVKRDDVKRNDVKRNDVKRNDVKRHHVMREDEGSEVADDALRFTPSDSRFTPSDSRFTPSDSRFTPSDSRFTPSDSRFTPSDSRFTPSDSRFTPSDSRFTSSQYLDLAARILAADAAQLDALEREPLLATAMRVAAERRFFHWELELPEVFEGGRDGFDALVANPPWETVKPNSQEFWSNHNPLFRELGKQAALRFAEDLRADATIDADWRAYERGEQQQGAFFKEGPLYRSQGKGDTNTYKLFLERTLGLLREGGGLGIVMPSGLYTDLGAKELRERLFATSRVRYLLALTNEKYIFPAVHHSFRFVLLSLCAGGKTEALRVLYRLNIQNAVASHELAGLLANLEPATLDLRVADIRRFSPDSLSLMEFKSQREVDVAAQIYDGHPLLGEEVPEAWNIRFASELHMTGDSELFYNRHQLDRLLKSSNGNVFLPLFEGKILHQFSASFAEPRYWVREDDASQKLDRGVSFGRYRAAYRLIQNSQNERTLIVSPLPKNVVLGHSLAAIVLKSNKYHCELLLVTSLMNSFILDLVQRMKTNANLTMFYVYQLPLPRLTHGSPHFDALVPRAARLTCTSPEFAGLWNEIAQHYPELAGEDPLRFTNHVLRAQLRAEIDALVADLYGLSEEDFAYILSTFPLLDRGQPALAGDVDEKGASRSYITRDTALLELFKLRGKTPPADIVAFFATAGADIARLTGPLRGLGERVAAALALGAVGYVPGGRGRDVGEGEEGEA